MDSVPKVSRYTPENGSSIPKVPLWGIGGQVFRGLSTGDLGGEDGGRDSGD